MSTIATTSFYVELDYKRPTPSFATTVEAVDQPQAIKIAGDFAKANGFPSTPKKTKCRKVSLSVV